MRSLYNIAAVVFFLLSAPSHFFRIARSGNWRRGFGQRLGLYDKDIQQSLTNRHVVWVLAAGKPQIDACAALVNGLHERFPNAKVVVSTTTPAGLAELWRHLPAQFGKTYSPFDRHKYVAMAFRAIHPTAIILLEDDIRPNLIWRACASHIPLFLLNARLSDRSCRRYRRFGFLFRELFAAFTTVGAQDEEQAAILRELGCQPDAVHVVGSLEETQGAVARTLEIIAGPLVERGFYLAPEPPPLQGSF